MRVILVTIITIMRMRMRMTMTDKLMMLCNNDNNHDSNTSNDNNNHEYAVVVDRFYTALFSALEQAHGARLCIRDQLSTSSRTFRVGMFDRSPPPHSHSHTHTHTHTHTHRSASQSCVDCTTVWPVCVQRPAVSTFRRHHGSESWGLLRLFLGTPAPTVPSRRHLQQQRQGLWLGCQYELRWQRVRPWSVKHSDNCCEIHSHAEIHDETYTEISVGF